MPSVDSLEALDRAVAGFQGINLALVIEPPALAAARRSLDESGLLLGEVQGVRENPLVIRALMQAFGLTELTPEWPDELAPVIAAYLAGSELADHPAPWLGDGRITAGHRVVLREITGWISGANGASACRHQVQGLESRARFRGQRRGHSPGG